MAYYVRLGLLLLLYISISNPLYSQSYDNMFVKIELKDEDFVEKICSFSKYSEGLHESYITFFLCINNSRKNAIKSAQKLSLNDEDFVAIRHLSLQIGYIRDKNRTLSTEIEDVLYPKIMKILKENNSSYGSNRQLDLISPTQETVAINIEDNPVIKSSTLFKLNYNFVIEQELFTSSPFMLKSLSVDDTNVLILSTDEDILSKLADAYLEFRDNSNNYDTLLTEYNDLKTKYKKISGLVDGNSNVDFVSIFDKYKSEVYKILGKNPFGRILYRYNYDDSSVFFTDEVHLTPINLDKFTGHMITKTDVNLDKYIFLKKDDFPENKIIVSQYPVLYFDEYIKPETNDYYSFDSDMNEIKTGSKVMPLPTKYYKTVLGVIPFFLVIALSVCH